MAAGSAFNRPQQTERYFTGLRADKPRDGSEGHAAFEGRAVFFVEHRGKLLKCEIFVDEERQRDGDVARVCVTELQPRGAGGAGFNRRQY